MAKKKTVAPEFDALPPKDEAAKIAEQIVEANLMISEGNEKREELQSQLADILERDGKKKITIFCEADQCYRTFSLKIIKAKKAITVRKEQAETE